MSLTKLASSLGIEIPKYIRERGDVAVYDRILKDLLKIRAQQTRDIMKTCRSIMKNATRPIRAPRERTRRRKSPAIKQNEQTKQSPAIKQNEQTKQSPAIKQTKPNKQSPAIEQNEQTKQSPAIKQTKPNKQSPAIEQTKPTKPTKPNGGARPPPPPPPPPKLTAMNQRKMLMKNLKKRLKNMGLAAQNQQK